jgi:hypothetical protein
MFELEFKHSTISVSSAVDLESKTGELAFWREPGKLRHSPLYLKDGLMLENELQLMLWFVVEIKRE